MIPSKLTDGQALTISAPGGTISFLRFSSEEIWTAAIDSGSDPRDSSDGMLIFETDVEADALFAKWDGKATVKFWSSEGCRETGQPDTRLTPDG